MHTPEIKIHAVGKKFSEPPNELDAQWIFRDISLEIQKNQSMVMMGPSGSGKSLLLRIIAGLTAPDEGTVTVKSGNLSMLFQKNALFDSLTAEENLLLPLKECKGIIGKKAKSITHHFLSEVELTGSEDLFPDELSGGMQKRLGIARALILSPEIILYDEPTAGLDPITSRTIAELILKLKAETESTLLSVTNDIQRAFQLGDSIYLLAQGKLQSGGSPAEMRKSKNLAINQFINGLPTGPLTNLEVEH